MTVKHMPGPWKEFAVDIPGDIDPNYRTIRAGCGFFSEDGFAVTGFIQPENARLMKESPDMLEVVEIIANATGDTDLQHAQEMSKGILMRLKVLQIAENEALKQ